MCVNFKTHSVVPDKTKSLLQALNDQNQGAIYDHLTTPDVRRCINGRSLTKNIQNPVRQFTKINTITCLTFASLVSDDATVRQLVEAGADIAATDSWDHSALHYACASDVDSDAKVAYLMQRGASSQIATDASEQVVLGPEFYSRSLRLAAWLNQASRVRALIDDHHASVNATDGRGRTALHAASRAGSAEATN